MIQTLKQQLDDGTIDKTTVKAKRDELMKPLRLANVKKRPAAAAGIDASKSGDEGMGPHQRPLCMKAGKLSGAAVSSAQGGCTTAEPAVEFTSPQPGLWEDSINFFLS